MNCLYIDHTTHSFATLGRLHQRFIRKPPPLSECGLLLHTCHRVEWYSAAAEESLPLPELSHGKKVSGEREVLSRLSKIASGVISIVVGDTLVFRQVIAAGSRLAQGSPEHDIHQRAVRIAGEARRRFDLAPVVDYADVLQMLKLIDGKQGRPLATRLVIVGGGMLAQALAAQSGGEYSEVVLVTRNASRLRRTLAPLAINAANSITVMSPAAAVTEAVRSSFDLALATTSLNPGYLKNIGALAAHPNVSRTLDYCATPLLPRSTPRYDHISDKEIVTQIVEANQAVEERARSAAAWIDGMAVRAGALS